MAGDFDVQPLGTVAKVRSGYAFKSEDMGAVGLPVIKIKNVVRGDPRGSGRNGAKLRGCVVTF